MIYRKLHKLICQSTQAGYTLVESMVGMVLVGILATSILPIFGFSIASRVQARRTELAGMAARTYIDGVRSDVIDDPDFYTTNPNSVSEVDVGELQCDESNNYCTKPTLTNQGALFCINNDDQPGCQDSSVLDMVLHVGSFNPLPEFYQDSEGELLTSGEANYDIGYNLDVRVYRADAFSESGKLLRSNATDPKTARVSGLAKKKAPLLEISTEITTGDTNYFELKNLLEN